MRLAFGPADTPAGRAEAGGGLAYVRVSCGHLDLRGVPSVVEVATLVPHGFLGLHAAAAVGRASEKRDPPGGGRRVTEGPEPPGIGIVLWVQSGRPPGLSAVVGELDFRDVRRSGEGEASESDRLARSRACRRLRDVRLDEELGDHSHFVGLEGNSRWPGLLRILVGGLHVETLLRLRLCRETPEPLHPVVSGPAGNDQASRRSVKRRERLAVHLVGDKTVFQRLLDLDASLKRGDLAGRLVAAGRDRKSTRLNSSHGSISYAVFCLKKKKKKKKKQEMTQKKKKRINHQ